MKRFIFLLVFALVATACGNGDKAAATVDGMEITFNDLSDLRPDLDTQPLAATVSDLELLVIMEILTNGADTLGLSVTDQEISEELELIKTDIVAAQGISWEEVLLAQELTPPLVDVIVEQTLLQEKVIDHFGVSLEVTDDELQAAYNSQLQAVSNVCASHILFEADDEATALEVLALASEEDADFAALAVEHSVGPSGPTGGDLGCVAPSGYVPSFGQATLDAEIGVPYGPVETQFGHHLILVTERTVPTFEEMQADLLVSTRATKAQSEVGLWFNEVLLAADVTVDETIGAWLNDPQSGLPGITPAS